MHQQHEMRNKLVSQEQSTAKTVEDLRMQLYKCELAHKETTQTYEAKLRALHSDISLQKEQSGQRTQSEIQVRLMDQEQVHNQQLHNMQASYSKELDRAEHDKNALKQQCTDLE